MADETPQGHFEYPDIHEIRWYRNGEVIEIEGTAAEQTHDGIVDWLEQLEIRLTGVVQSFGDLPEPDSERTDPRTGAERIYLVRNRETFYRDTGDDWVATGGDEGDAVGAGFGLLLEDSYELDPSENITWTGRHTFNDNTIAFTIGDQGTNPASPGDVTRDGNDVLVHSGNTVVNLSDIGTGGGGGGGTNVISSPNLPVAYTELADGQRIGNPVVLESGATIDVRSWGAVDTAGDTPNGLRVELLDPNGDVVESNETQIEATSGGVAEYENNSGGSVAVTLAIHNDTGSDYTDPDGVGGHFGYIIQ